MNDRSNNGPNNKKNSCYKIRQILSIFLSNHPLTKIFYSNNKYAIYKRPFTYEYITTKIVFFFKMLSLLAVLNTVFFSDKLTTYLFENNTHVLPLNKYILNSFVSGLISFIAGIFFLALNKALFMKINIKEVYDKREFNNELHKIESSYLMRMTLFFILGIGMVAKALYYLSVFANFFRNSYQFLVAQIVVSYVIEGIFYGILAVLLSMENEKRREDVNNI